VKQDQRGAHWKREEPRTASQHRPKHRAHSTTREQQIYENKRNARIYLLRLQTGYQNIVLQQLSIKLSVHTFPIFTKNPIAASFSRQDCL